MQTIACSQFIADSNIPRSIVSDVVNNGVDTQIFVPLTDKRNIAKRRAELCLPSDARVLIYTGPLIDRKNPELLIKAMKLRSEHNDHLVMLGNGPLFTRCKTLSENMSNVSVMGTVDNVLDYLQVSDIFVSLSTA